MHHVPKVAFHTLGCKLNFSETSTIARDFRDSGFARVEPDEGPDVLVLNTCSVTDNADKKCRNAIRKTLKHNPQAFVVVIGCYAQLKPKEIAGIEGVDLVLGANEKFNVLEHLGDWEKKPVADIHDTEIKTTKEFVPGYSLGDRTRSFLKVQDGCDYFCSFCTIPLARGRSRSQTIAETMAVARELEATSVREVVLTGVNIGDFGKGTDETFLDLCRELDQLEGIDRFRISSIEPNLLSDDIIHFVAESQRFAPHFHIPLQSGSDALLASMRRRYRTELYRNRVATIKRLMPHCCIGVDVIVGYPGETDEVFQETYDFLNRLDVSYLHVFTYSERANTTAVRMDEAVPMNVRQERSKMLRILSAKKKRAFYESQTNTHHTVLLEGTVDEGRMHGFTENYVKVQLPYNPDMVNQLVPFHLKTIGKNGLFEGEITGEAIPNQKIEIKTS